tara:strand:- start:3310 stop:4299 length:990 start_codon:yes stop_codon:yes gene_type:complete
MPNLSISYLIESFALRVPFGIARGEKNKVDIIKVKVTDGLTNGYGECSPNLRYNQTIETEIININEIILHFQGKDITNKGLQFFDPSPARSAIDNAIWDFNVKKNKTTIWEYLGLKKPNSFPTAITIDLSSMGRIDIKTNTFRSFRTIKIKLDGTDDDYQRLKSIREKFPYASIIVDANESIKPGDINSYIKLFEEHDVSLIEQPLKSDLDSYLMNTNTKIPICADESCLSYSDIEHVKKYYKAINIKLDKCGGLFEAIKMIKAAKKYDLKIMAGCMLCTSLGIAPAQIVAMHADFIDLDGPIFLEKDRENKIEYKNGLMKTSSSELWG